MNRGRIVKMSMVGLLALTVAAFTYFAVIGRQPRHGPSGVQAASAKDVYYCPMHKNYHSDKPGNCPICSMKLVKLEKPGAAPPGPTPSATPHDSAIFIAPEKQQLIGMRSVSVEMGTLTKEIR